MFKLNEAANIKSSLKPHWQIKSEDGAGLATFSEDEHAETVRVYIKVSSHFAGVTIEFVQDQWGAA